VIVLRAGYILFIRRTTYKTRVVNMDFNQPATVHVYPLDYQFFINGFIPGSMK